MNKPSTQLANKHGYAISAASDGACSGNPGPGGWGALIRFEDGTVKEFGGYEPATTNNRMELLGVLAILKQLKNLPCSPDLKIRTDSKYVINGLTNWIKNWKRNGWRTASGKPVLNKDLWQLLDHASLKNVKLEYVKGHSGDEDNERVDKIAVSYSKGTHINLNLETTTSSNESTKAPLIKSNDRLNEPAPEHLKALLTRLDMINHLAKHGYALSLVELAELLDIPVIELQKKSRPWQWREWLIEPAGDCEWRVRLDKKKPPTSK